MKVDYSKRATADLRKVSTDSRAFGEMVAAAVESRLREIVVRISEQPEGAPRVVDRPGVHVAALVRYPFVIFYRILEDRVRILHICHTSRQVWEGEDSA
jgi:toxin ParE1/3/4